MPEPKIDPLTGKPIADPNASQPPTVDDPNYTVVSKEDLASMRGKLDAFDKIGTNFQQPAAQPQQPQSSGPTLAEQLQDTQAKIEKLNTQIDQAIADQQPVSKLLSQRDALNSKALRLQIQEEDLGPLRMIGTQALNQLSDTVTRQGMKHFDVVKDDFNSILSTVPEDQRMLPEVRKIVYETAVGRNTDKIFEAEREKILREAAEQQALDTNNNSGRTVDKDGNEIPKPVDILGEGAMAALKTKGQSVDQYYQTLGYTGYQDWWEKTGKEFYEEEA